MEKNLIAIGKIISPHGVRGYNSILPLTDFPERFKKLKTVLLANEYKLTLTSVKYHNKLILIKFLGYDDINSVEQLKGNLIFVYHKDLVKLPKHHYYNFDIIGLKVYDNKNKFLGIITEIIKTGSNDVYVVKYENRQPILIPALKKIVQVVDIKNGKIIINLMKELD